MSKSNPWSQGRKVQFGKKTYNVVCIQKVNGNNDGIITLGKRDISKETRKRTQQVFANCVWLSGRM